MRKFVAVLLLLALSPMAALAHHKPGHNPPGQLKKFQGLVELRVPVPVAPPSVAISEVSDEIGWRRYEHDVFAFGVDLPLALFEVSEELDRGVRLREIDGWGELEVYGAENALGLSPREFVNTLERADRIAEITYRAEGRSWFVLSGYYADEGDLGEPIIFYAKFMFSADRSRVSAFEISYPESDKRRFDRIVTHVEKSLTAPS